MKCYNGNRNTFLKKKKLYVDAHFYERCKNYNFVNTYFCQQYSWVEKYTLLSRTYSPNFRIEINWSKA